MKRLLIRRLSFCSGIGVLLCCAARDNLNAQDFTYTNNNGAITITRYIGPGGSVAVPASIDTLPVTTIGDWAFGDNTNLTGVTLPNSVTNIGNWAFSYCPKLSTASIGGGILTIGDYAFTGCGLVAIVLPESLKSIGSSAFSGCSAVTNMEIPAGVTNIGHTALVTGGSLVAINVTPLNPAYSSMDGVFFDKGQTTLLGYPPGRVASAYVIPNSVTALADSAFAGSAALSQVTFGSNLVSIGDSAFSNSGLLDATLPGGVKTIGSLAFSYCGITSISLPDGITNLGGASFLSCGLTNATIPGSLAVLPDQAFAYCTRLTDLVLENGIQMIGNDAFTLCSVRRAQIPDSVTSIGDEAFYNCYSLTNVTLGAGLTNVGVRAFSGSFSLKAFEVAALNPDYSTQDGVLFNKAKTTLVECPGGMSGTYAVPNGVITIGDYAFYQCNGFSTVALPDSLVDIGIGAFFYSALTTMTIPGNVRSIGGFAFINSFQLHSMYFEGNQPDADMTVFGVSPTTVYYLPGTAGWGGSFSGRPLAVWVRANPVILSPHASSGGQSAGFMFTISWATNIPVVVEASTNLLSRSWLPVSTNTLVGGQLVFRDAHWTNFPNRVYRVRSP